MQVENSTMWREAGTEDLDGSVVCVVHGLDVDYAIEAR